MELEVQRHLVHIFRDVGVVESPVEEDGEDEDQDDGEEGVEEGEGHGCGSLRQQVYLLLSITDSPVENSLASRDHARVLHSTHSDLKSCSNVF